MAEQRYLYIIFLSTPYVTGSVIRAVTGFPYNHMGISFSSKPKYFHSFSRFYKPAPFFAGFTKESVLRYRNRGKTALMKICAVPVSEDHFREAENHLRFFESHSDEFVYNLISAFCFPLRKKIKIDREYTCQEFVLEMLKKYSNIPEFKEAGFFTIKESHDILSPYEIFEGSAEYFFENADWSGDSFMDKKNLWFYTKNTFYNNGRLVFRFLKGKSRKK